MIDTDEVVAGLEWILADDKFGFGMNWDDGVPRDEYEKAGQIITSAVKMLKNQARIIDYLNDRLDMAGVI